MPPSVDFVLPHFHRHGRHRRHWLNPRDIDLRKLLDESQHGVELARKVLDLVFSHGDARKMRHPADGFSINGHGVASAFLLPVVTPIAERSFSANHRPSSRFRAKPPTLCDPGAAPSFSL